MAKVDQARYDAFEKLLKMQQASQFISHNDDDSSFSQNPKATHLVAGVTRWQAWLDFIIDSFVKGDPSKLQDELRIVLRLGAFELLIQEEVAYASINDAVNLAKKKVMDRAGGLVNGVLRTIDRQRESLPEPKANPRTNYLAVTRSHPEWMVKRWAAHMSDDELVALLNANNEVPRFFMRVNTLKSSIADLSKKFDLAGIAYREVEDDPYLFEVLRIKPILNFLKEGMCFVQDRGAGMAADLLAPKPGESVLDMCAAPGGKSMQIAGLMQNSGRLVAADLSQRRLEMVKQNAEAMSATVVEPYQGDMTKTKANEIGRFDAILLDAPCSGTGVLSKRADLRWNRKESDLKDLIELQTALFRSGLDLLVPGGRIVYSTCSIEADENEMIVESMLQENPKLKQVEETRRTRPDRDQCDGAYSCLLELS